MDDVALEEEIDEEGLKYTQWRKMKKKSSTYKKEGSVVRVCRGVSGRVG